MENKVTTWIKRDTKGLIVFSSDGLTNNMKCFSLKISHQQSTEPPNANISSQPGQNQTPTSRAGGGCAASREFMQRE